MSDTADRRIKRLSEIMDDIAKERVAEANARGWSTACHECEKKDARIRELDALLDECKRALEEIASLQVVVASDVAVVTLRKIRAQERD